MYKRQDQEIQAQRGSVIVHGQRAVEPGFELKSLDPEQVQLTALEKTLLTGTRFSRIYTQKWNRWMTRYKHFTTFRVVVLASILTSPK